MEGPAASEENREYSDPEASGSLLRSEWQWCRKLQRSKSDKGREVSWRLSIS